jgi:hypothetical protein
LATADHDIRAFARQGKRNFFPNTATTASNDGDFVH